MSVKRLKDNMNKDERITVEDAIKLITSNVTDSIRNDMQEIKIAIGAASHRFNRFDTQLDAIHAEIKELGRETRREVGSIKKDGWKQFKWIVGIMVSLFVTITTLVMKGHVS